MQRKIIVNTTLALSLLVASCGKDTPLSPQTTDDQTPLKYEIQNLKDTSLERIGEVRYLITVKKLSGRSENIVLSGEELPKGMEVRFDPVNGVEPSFNTTVVITNTRVAEGTHRINIQGASASSGISKNYINVTVLPYSNEAMGLKGDFTEQGKCSGSGDVNDKVTIAVDDSVKNRIVLKGLFSGVMSNKIVADLDAAKHTLTIPKQVVNAVTYEGDGTYDDDKVVINYTITGVTINESCTTTLTRN